METRDKRGCDGSLGSNIGLHTTNTLADILLTRQLTYISGTGIRFFTLHVPITKRNKWHSVNCLFQVDAVLNLVSTLVCDQEDQPSEPVSILLVINLKMFSVVILLVINKTLILFSVL